MTTPSRKRTPKPRLTDRVLRGILNLEIMQGFTREEYADYYPDALRGSALKDYDDAQAAKQWAHAMIAWRAERKS